MDDALLTQLLVDGGSLAMFVIFVLYLTKAQASERLAWLAAMRETQDRRDTVSQGNMALGMTSLDKTNGNIRELTQANIELSKALAVHDVRATGQMDQVQDGVTLVIAKLDTIKDALAQK